MYYLSSFSGKWQSGMHSNEMANECRDKNANGASACH